MKNQLTESVLFSIFYVCLRVSLQFSTVSVMAMISRIAGALLGSGIAFALTKDKWKTNALTETKFLDIEVNLPAVGVPPSKLHSPVHPSDVAAGFGNEDRLQKAIRQSQSICGKLMVEHGLPGLAVAVTVNGQPVWSEGFGYADIENSVPMKPGAVIRIASISKSLTMAMLAKLMEDGLVDIDCPIQTYLPAFPTKSVDGKPVTITTRHLLSHLSGIRHYDKKGEKKSGAKRIIGNEVTNNNKVETDPQKEEFYLDKKFKTLEEAMQLFQDDELFHEPGSKYLYSTHAWTVVSAVIEKVGQKPFTKIAKQMFEYWGLNRTYLDEHEPIIFDRARYYSKDPRGKLQNSPYVDNSYKWSGGGFLSTVADLTQFANMLMYCYQHRPTASLDSCGLPKKPYLTHDTMKKMWTGDPRTCSDGTDLLYGLGFVIGEPMRNCMFGKTRELMTVHHSGGAMGASSILLMAFPKDWTASQDEVDSIQRAQSPDVKGVAVAMITNLTDVGMSAKARDIADHFKHLM